MREYEIQKSGLTKRDVQRVFDCKALFAPHALRTDVGLNAIEYRHNRKLAARLICARELGVECA